MNASAAALPSPGSPRAWITAARLPTLVAAVVPVAVGVGVAMSQRMFSPGPAVAALVGAILIQIGTNFANDVFDYEKGADTSERLGPLRTAQAGLLTPTALRRGCALVFVLATFVGLYLAWVSSPWILAVGFLSITAGLAYTGGPFPLGYNGLGDVFVFVFFGWVAVVGTVFVQAVQVPAAAWFASIPVGALATNLLVVNNLRDLPTDVNAGKRTLAVRFGRRFVLGEFVVLTAVAYATPWLLYAYGLADGWVFLSWLTVPLAVVLSVRVFRWEGRRLNVVLVGSAQLLLSFGLLFASGLALG